MANYVKSILRPGSKIFLVGEAPGAEEDMMGQPFVGKAGKLLNQLLDQAGINRAEVSIANVARQRPPGNKIGFFFEDVRCTIPKPIMKQWLEELKEEIVQRKPNIVVAMGATAMWALTGEKGIAAERGYIRKSSLVPGQKMLTTYHPQKVGYEWNLAFEVILDLRKAKRESNSPEILPDSRVLHAYPSTSEFMEYLRYLLFEHKEPVAVDIETTDNCHIDIIGLADSAHHAMSFEFIQNRKPRLSATKEFEVWNTLDKVLRKRTLIFQNGMYDAAVLLHHNSIYTSGYKHDTMIAAHCCWPESKRSLAFLSSVCLNVPKWKHTSTSAPAMYNCADAANTFGVWTCLEHEMDLLGVRHTYDFEMLQIWPAMFLQLQGLLVDKEKQSELINSIKQRLVELDSEIKSAVGKEVNLNSPKQLQTLLYIDMKLPIQYKRRKSRHDDRKMTADNQALKLLARQTQNPLLDKIMESKKLTKLLSFVEVETCPEGRVYTSYNITGATMLRSSKGKVVDDEGGYKSFGRWSSSKSIIKPYGSGNLQNIPKKARNIYIPPPGYCLLQADYIQAEAVVVAYLTRNEVMMKLFKESFGLSREEKGDKYDVHKLTASMMFKLPIEEVTKELRDIGKMLRHACNYSAGPGVVANGLNCTMKEAKEMLQLYHHADPQLQLWHREIQNELRQTRTLTNLLGRKHRFTERWGDELFRSAYSFKPQSTVGDLTNTALVRFYNRFGSDTSIALQLHDAIYVYSEISDSAIRENMEKLREAMLMPLEANGEKFYIDVDFSVGKTWGSMEEV